MIGAKYCLFLYHQLHCKSDVYTYNWIIHALQPEDMKSIQVLKLASKDVLQRTSVLYEDMILYRWCQHILYSRDVMIRTYP